MNKTMKPKTMLNALLVVSFIGMTLSGCAVDDSGVGELSVEQEISPENLITANEPISESQMPSDYTEKQETAADPQNLYEQFLNNEIPVIINNNLEDGYTKYIFKESGSYTLAELSTYVSNFFLNPEYTDKTSCDDIQYAYVECSDSSDENARNLLIKFVGLNFHYLDDDSCFVFLITEDHGQLYVTGAYQCWARSETTAYANGILRTSASGGAGVSYDRLSVILSDGKQAPIYDATFLYGGWTSDVSRTIYLEVLDEYANAGINLTISIYAIGNDKYYLYDIGECSEEEKARYELYINRCHDEEGINWVTEEEIQTAIQNQCNAVGIDYSITNPSKEAEWNSL